MPSSLRLHPEPPVVRVEMVGDDGFPRLSTSLLRELDAAFTQLLADPCCHALILHGSDKALAAGAEISELAALTGPSALDFSRRAQLLFERIAGSPKPVLAAIRGYCLGGGLDLALACHYRLAAPDAVFGHPGASLGVITGWGGTQRLPRLLGRARALELLLLGEPILAEQALRFGLIDDVALPEGLLARGAEMAHTLIHHRGTEESQRAR